MGRGNTTTELHELYGGWIADTPGFSSLDFSGVDPLELSQSIPDFQIEEPCRFRDCIHQNEPGCAIKEAVKQGKVSIQKTILKYWKLKRRERNAYYCTFGIVSGLQSLE